MLSTLKYKDRNKMDQLFNQGGYVLDFSTERFDSFTKDSVGIRLCEKYNLSKGKSLWQFIEEAEDYEVKKLLDDLLEYYEDQQVDPSLSATETGIETKNNQLFDQCKKIVKSLSTNKVVQSKIDGLKESFNTRYMNDQINLMEKSIEENPTDAIGKAKELLESCCKTILTEMKISIDKNWSVQKLTKETCKHLKLTPDDIDNSAFAGDVIRKILGNLSGISVGMAELRNPYGGGHGKQANYQGLSPRHARLATGASVTAVQFLWETHLENEGNQK